MRERKREEWTVNHKKKIIKIVRESLKFPKQREPCYSSDYETNQGH